jgi:multidrug efflux pump
MYKFFIERPIVSMVIAAIMVIVGAVAVLGLPTAQFPNIADPQIQVLATYVGADALTVEQSVATPIEQQMSGVDNMEYMYSLNANNGQVTLTVDFNIKTDASTDQILAQMRQNQAASQLPTAVNNYGVTVQKSTQAPMMLFDLYSPNGTYDSRFLANYTYINLKDGLTQVPGIASVSVFGAGQYAMRIWVKPDQLAKLQVTVPDIINAIQVQNNVNPAGQIGGEPVPAGQEYTYAVRAQGRLISEQEFGEIVVRAQPDGSVLRLRDVARIELGAQVYNMLGRLDGKPSAVIAVYQLPGSNAVAAAKGVIAYMEEQKKRFPPGLDYVTALDTTLPVTEGIKEIEHTLLEALVLVILVVYIFLQGWRATLIPLLAVPVSLIGTFMVFPLLGFSVNTLSLFGLVLAIGLVVDDAIVVVEAVEHHIEHGLSPKEAALKAMEEVSAPVIGIAVILSAVFIPTAFVPGITGRLYQQFAVTIAVSVIFSAFNALTLSPALSALLLRPKKESRGPLGKFFAWFNRVFTSATNHYVTWCRFFIHKLSFAVILLLGFTVLAGFSGSKLPTSFLPDEDQGYVFVVQQLPDASSLQRTSAAAEKVEEILMKTPGIAHVTTVIGYSMLSGVQNTYSTFFWVTFKPWHERTAKEEQYMDLLIHLNNVLGELPAARHSRSRRIRRCDVHIGRPWGPRCGISCGTNEEVYRGSEQAARDSSCFHHQPSFRSSGVREGRPRQGAYARCAIEGRLWNAANVHGRRVHQLFQPLRPPVAGVYAGRRGLSHARGKSRPVLRPQFEWEYGAAVGCHLHPEYQRTGIHYAIQPPSRVADQRDRRARIQFQPSHAGA